MLGSALLCILSVPSLPCWVIQVLKPGALMLLTEPTVILRAVGSSGMGRATAQACRREQNS